MAIRFDADTDGVSVATNLPGIALYTFLGWFKISVDTDAYACFMKVGGLVNPTAYEFEMGSDGTTLQTWNGSTEDTGSNLTVGRWYYIAGVCSGTGAGQLLVYLDGALNITAAGNPTATSVELSVGRFDSASTQLPFNGCAQDVMVYNRALSQREIVAQMRQRVPIQTAGLLHWLPFNDVNSAVVNYGGINSLWTATGSLTQEAGPNIPWILPVRRRVYFFPGGPVITPLSLSSSVVPVSSMVKVASKSVSSVVTPVSTVRKVAGKIVGSAVTPVSSVVKIAGKAVGSSVVPVTAVVKIGEKRVSSLAGVSSSVSKLVVKGGFGSVIVPLSALVKVAVKVFDSAVTPVSDVAVSAIKALVLGSVVVPVSSLVKVVSKSLNSAAIVNSAVVKVAVKVLSSIVVPVSAITKVAVKSFNSIVTPVSTLLQSAIKVVSLSSFVTPVSSISKVAVKSMGSVVQPVTTVTKVVSKALSDEIVPVTLLVKNYLQYVVLNSVVTPVSSIVTQFIAGSGLPSLNSLLPWKRRRRK